MIDNIGSKVIKLVLRIQTDKNRYFVVIFFPICDILFFIPAYHCHCVDPWLTTSKRVCPLCKRRVLSDDESSNSEDETDGTFV